VQVDLVFLTARPHVYKDLVEGLTYKKYEDIVDAGLMHSMPTILPGHLRHSVQAGALQSCVGNESWRNVGEMKNMCYRKYARLYQEYDFIFCGDNGQGDLLAGERMVYNQSKHGDNDDFAPNLICVLIHQVLPEEQHPLAATPVLERAETWEADLRKRNLFMHRTYVGAAVDLHSAGLLSASEVRVVALQALDDFERIRMTNSEFGTKHGWDQAEEHLLADLARTNTVLRAKGEQPLPPMACYENLMQEWSVSYTDSDEEETGALL